MTSFFQPQRLLPDRWRRVIVLLFFGTLLVGGLGLVRDYGISFDEGTQRITGRVSLLYVFQRLPAAWQQRLLSPQAAVELATHRHERQLPTYRDRDYGVAFELPLAAAEQLLPLRDMRQVYLLRHACNFLVCFAAFISFYQLVRQRFGSWRLALLGTALLVLSPRLFADYFYNSKDAVFLATFVLGTGTAVAFLRRPTAKAAAWHALACALAIGVRIMGVLLPAATLAFLGLRAASRAYAAPARLPRLVLLYGGLLAGLVVAGWPLLWEAPLANFLRAFRTMSHYHWPGWVLYQGQLVSAQHLPWHYALVWIGLTTPLLYLGGFGLGAGLIAYRGLARGWQSCLRGTEWQDWLFLGLTLAPLFTVISLHSVLYNGWRQLYFIYPTFLLVALRGLVAAGRWRPASPRLAGAWYWGGRAVAAAALLLLAARMVALHPYEHLYFNGLTPAHPERFYESDYWGLSTRAGLAWVMAHDGRPQVRVQQLAAIEEPLLLNYQLLPPAARQRLRLVPDAAQADYIIQPYSYQRAAAFPTPCYSLYVEQMHILDVFCRRPTPPTPALRAAGRAGE